MIRLLKKLFGRRSKSYKEYHITNIAFGCIELAGCSEEEAQTLAEEKHSDIEYGHKYRLSPSIIAGAILGINDCCITAPQIKL